MNELLKYSLTSSLLFGSIFVFAQDNPEQDNLIQRRIETIAEQLGEGDEGLDFNTLLEFFGNKWLLNRAKQLIQLINNN